MRKADAWFKRETNQLVTYLSSAVSAVTTVIDYLLLKRCYRGAV